MNEASEPDRIVELLRAGYAAPPPRAEFVRSLADRLGREAAQPALSLRAPGTARRPSLLPAALAASFLLAVTLTLLALRPGRLEWNPEVSVRGGDVAFLGRLGRDGKSAVQWRFVSPEIRWGEADHTDALKHAFSLRLGDAYMKLGESGEPLGDVDLAAPLYRWYEESETRDRARHHLFFSVTPQSLGRVKQLDAGLLPRPKLKEPEYLSKAPRYGLLVFGPKAETRVWLVLDLLSEPYDPKGGKDVLYVDRNGNGDLTEPGERIPVVMKEHKFVPFVSFSGYEPKEVTHYIPTFKIGDLVERDGKSRHTDVVVDVGEYLGQLRSCTVTVKVNGTQERQARDSLLRFSKRPEEAPAIHFNGPLTMSLSMETAAIHVPVNYEGGEWDPPRREVKHLVRGQEIQLYAVVGTPGVGAGTFLALSAGIPPAEVHPVAEIEFPHRDPKQPAIKLPVVLKERC